MFGPFRQSLAAFGGLLWKSPWRMSAGQKYRQRKRLSDVDAVIETLTNGLKLARQDNLHAGLATSTKSLRVLNKFFPKEAEMPAKDKYTLFNKTSKGYRKSLHKLPKWTKTSHRVNPEYF